MHGIKDHKRMMRLAKLKKEKRQKILKEQGQLLDDFLSQEDDSSRISRKIHALMTSKSLYESHIGSDVNTSGERLNIEVMEDPEQAKLMEMSRKVHTLIKDRNDQLDLPSDDRRRPLSGSRSAHGLFPETGSLSRSPSRENIPDLIHAKKPIETATQTSASAISTSNRVAVPTVNEPETTSGNINISKTSDRDIIPVMTVTSPSNEVLTAGNNRAYSIFARASTSLGLPGKEPKLAFVVPPKTAPGQSRARKKPKRAAKTSANLKKVDSAHGKLKPLLKGSSSKAASSKK